MSASKDSAPAIELAFLKRFLADRNRGEERPLADYQALFPGYEDLVEAAYSRALSEPPGAEERTFADGIDVGSSDVVASELVGESGSLGHYRVVSELGRGGQGVVYLAEDTRLGRSVALKMLTKVGMMSEQMVRRFRREAEVASRIAHPGICTVYDAGTAHGVPFIAMQYVEGETLAHRMREVRTGPSFVSLAEELPSEEIGTAESATASTTGPRTQAELNLVLELIEKTARALHAAHATGVIHRDIKPGNIMVTPDGEPVLLDFGLARELEASQASLTATGDLFGTLAYMSPEQLATKRIALDARTDVYSLGVSLYECVAGMRPFDAPTRQGLIQAILTTEPLNIRRLNKAVSRDLRVVVETAVETERDRRYSTALDLADDLSAVREGRPIAAKGIGTVGRMVRWSKREPAKAMLLALLLVASPTIAVLVTRHIENQPKLEAQRLVELQDRKDEQISAGYYELGEGDPELSIPHFLAALAEEGGSPEAALGVALAHLRRGRPQETLACLQRSGSEFSRSRAAEFLRVRALRELGRDDEADGVPAGAEPTAPLDFYLLGQVHLSRAHEPIVRSLKKAAFRDALSAFTSAVLLSDRPRALFYQARVHAAGHLGDKSVVHETTRALLAHWPKSASTVHEVGQALGMCGEFEEAARALRRAEAMAPKLPRVYASLGMVFWFTKRHSDAVGSFRRALHFDPENPTVLANLGCVLLESGEVDESIKVCRQAINLDRNNLTARNNLGAALNEVGKYDEAIKELREAVRIAGRSAESHFKLGQALINRRELDEAIKCFERAVRLDSSLMAAQNSLAAAWLDKGEFDKAIAAAREAIRIDARLPGPHQNLAAAMIGKGQLDEAVAPLRETIRLAPRLKWPHANLVEILTAQADNQGVAQELRRWAELHVDDASAWHDLALHLVRSGGSVDSHDSASALSAAKKAVELSKRQNPRALFVLAYALFRAEDYRPALSACQEALDVANGETPVKTALVASIEALARRIRRALGDL